VRLRGGVFVGAGIYKLTVDGGANFAVFENYGVEVAVGEVAAFNPRLQLRGMSQTVDGDGGNGEC
jgi:hypothetical protein